VPEASVADSLERIVFAGVALTTRALAEAMPSVELTFPQWRVLVVLGGNPAGATISEVAACIGVTPPATSRQLRRLERRGLVTVSPDERDRRASRVRLTADGTAARDAIVAYRRRLIDESLSGVELDPWVAAHVARLADAFDRW
jgi:DNA-binding MarR family transcriptional regulator